LRFALCAGTRAQRGCRVVSRSARLGVVGGGLAQRQTLRRMAVGVLRRLAQCVRRSNPSDSSEMWDASAARFAVCTSCHRVNELDAGSVRPRVQPVSQGADVDGRERSELIEIIHKETGQVICHVDRSTLAGAPLAGEDLAGANLRQADLSGADLRGAILEGALLREANLAGASLAAANLSWAALRFADLSGADLEDANLYAARLRGADLTRASLRSARLDMADLRQAAMRRADLTGASLAGTNLEHADLSGAILEAVDLGTAYVVGTLYDQLTRWPATFRPLAASTTRRR
jgi:uncharacterized protein YjbI with pentapeptide repeats